MQINIASAKAFFNKNRNAILAAIGVIVIVAGVWYWQSASKMGLPNPLGGGQQTSATEVITYTPPDVLPETTKEGLCWANSVAEPYRADAWRCQLTPENPEAEGVSASDIYDPCFSIASEDTVICDIDPIANTVGFQLLLSQPLPEPQPVTPAKENWGWMVELADGTLCAPFTGTLPAVNGQTAPYACASGIEGQSLVLLGDLKKDMVWTATEAEIAIENNVIAIKQSKEVDIKKVWQ